MIFLLFLEAPGDQPVEAHFVPATPSLSIFVGAEGVLALNLLVGADQS